MGFMASAIPIATSLLGALGDKGGQQAAQAAPPPPPTLGQIFAQNWQQNQTGFGHGPSGGKF